MGEMRSLFLLSVQELLVTLRWGVSDFGNIARF